MDLLSLPPFVHMEDLAHWLKITGFFQSLYIIIIIIIIIIITRGDLKKER